MKKSAFITKKKIDNKATIAISGSKSESNRALILRSISNGLVDIKNLSDANDTQVLQSCLSKIELQKKKEVLRLNVGPAGTAMRFLTAFLAFQEGEFEISGSERMHERPIKILVEALNSLGANIKYLGTNGYPPLRINGTKIQKTAEININGNVSSQYISALLLIAPALPLGLKLNIEGKLTSKPYVNMTLNMLNSCGIEYTWIENQIIIVPQIFKHSQLFIEPDWSSASYWYSIVANSDNLDLFLSGFKKDSLQGDQKIVEIMKNLGVETKYTSSGINLSRNKAPEIELIYDFIECPDLVQTVAVCCALLGKNLKMKGLETLKIKETDRIKALKIELSKLNVTLNEDGSLYELNTQKRQFPDKLSIKTYDDHRMAMAFAPLALKINRLEIEDIDVVGKSYPNFWNDLSKIGIQLT